MDVDRNILQFLDFPQGQVIKPQSRPGGNEGKQEDWIMIKKTKSNFSIAVSMLQNQAYYNYYIACDKANEIFKRVQTERNSGLSVTVETYLLSEIDKANEF